MIAQLFTFCLVFGATAATATTLNPVTLVPAVHSNDLEYPAAVHGPWFKTAYTIHADQTITVIGIEHLVRTKGSTTSYFNPIVPPVEIAADQTFTTEPVFVGRLPDQIDFVYDVEARVIGWLGSGNSIGPIFSTTSSFRTQ